MRKEFLIEKKPAEFYNYISGRVKVLENYLLTKEIFDRVASESSAEGVKNILSETPYKTFLSGSNFSDLVSSVFKRFNAELAEMEDAVSPGFVNSFFREKAIFLKLKKWALLGSGEEEGMFSDLFRFVSGGRGDFPSVFRKAFEAMSERKGNPLEVAILTDIYRIKFLSDSALLTGSELISSYYNIYAEKSVAVMLLRLYGFVKSSLVDNRSLSQTLGKVGMLLKNTKFSRELLSLKDAEQFSEFVESEVSENYVDTQSKKIGQLLEKGRFVNTGIEVVFSYLKRLQREVSVLSMLLSGKESGVSEKEITEKVSVGYE